MDTATDRPVVSKDQYTALQAPVVLPTPQDLLDFQVRTLKDKGLDLSDADVKQLRPLVPKEPQLFIVVPCLPDPLDLDGLMALIEVDGLTGKNYLDQQKLFDELDTPRQAHLLLGVEDGRKRLNIKPSVSLKNIKAENRIPYTVWSGLVHVMVFPYVLYHHCLHLCGSRYGSGHVPGLSLDIGGFPGLGCFWDDIAGPRAGTPSAGSVVVP